MVTGYVEVDASNKLLRLGFSLLPSQIPLSAASPYLATLFINTLHNRPVFENTKGHLQFKPPILVEFSASKLGLCCYILCYFVQKLLLLSGKESETGSIYAL